jgi:hypothetical protein
MTRGAASAFAKDRSPRNVPSTRRKRAGRGVSGCIPSPSGFNESQLALAMGLQTDYEPRGEMSD